MPEKIYVVTAGVYSDYHIVAVCSDKSRAQEIANIYNLNHSSSTWGDAEVVEYTDGCLVDLSRSAYYISLRENGSILSIKELYEESKIDCLFEVFESNGVRRLNSGEYIANIIADNKDQAIKIARDKIAELKAEGVS